MTRTELAKGSAVFLAVAVAGFLSVRSIDRHDAIDQPSVADTPPDVSADTRKKPPTRETPCVGEDGTWKNWVWANVPMLSPKCPPGR
jgi:hypothetical protein